MLLTSPDVLPPATERYLADRADSATSAYLYGSPAAVGPAVSARLSALIGS